MSLTQGWPWPGRMAVVLIMRVVRLVRALSRDSICLAHGVG